MHRDSPVLPSDLFHRLGSHRLGLGAARRGLGHDVLASADPGDLQELLASTPSFVTRYFSTALARGTLRATFFASEPSFEVWPTMFTTMGSPSCRR